MEPGREKLARIIPLDGRRMSDAEIVEGLRRREVKAAAVMYRRYAGRVERLVWRLLGADPEQEDVVQQVFVNALASIQKLRNPDSLEAWLVGITVRTVRREIRSRKVRSVIQPSTERAERAAGGDRPERGLVVKRMYRTLGRLKADQQIALTLRYVEGCTLVETAEACGCSLATVKRRLVRARRAFFRLAGRDPVLGSWVEEARYED